MHSISMPSLFLPKAGVERSSKNGLQGSTALVDGDRYVSSAVIRMIKESVINQASVSELLF